MKKKIFILDKQFRFKYECSFIFILLLLFVTFLIMFAFSTDPEYLKNEPVLEIGIVSLLLFILVLFARITLKRYAYIDLEKKELRIYFKVFSFEATSLITELDNINEIGVNSTRYTVSNAHHGGRETTSDHYHAIILRSDGKIFRVSGESGLFKINDWAENLTEKFHIPFLPGKEACPIGAVYDEVNSKYKLTYLSGYKMSLARANCYEITILALCVLIFIAISINYFF